MTDEHALAKKADADLTYAPFTYRTLREIAATEFVPKALRNRPDAILAAIYTGRELGLGPMESLSKIDVIDGRPAPSAELLVAMVFRAGHRIWPGDLSHESATAVGQRYRHGEPAGEPVEFTFTMDDASRAGLAGKSNFKAYPKAMLYWRAASQPVRIYFPDVVSAFKAYTPDELGDDEWVPPDPEEIHATVIPDEEGGDDDGTLWGDA